MNTKAILTALLMCFAACLTTVITTSSYAQTVDECIICHQDRTLTKTAPDGTFKSLYVDREAFLKSVHAEAGFTCVDCHDDAQPLEHPAQGLTKVECKNCHDDIAEIQAKSTHGRLLGEGKSEAPNCYDCHSTHAVMRSDNPLSTVHPDNLQQTCGACHANEAAPVVCEAVLELLQGDMSALQRISLPSTLAMLTAQLKGHGKTDFGCSYNTKRCSNCHTDVTKHGGGTQEPPVCSKCHDMERNSFLLVKIHKPTIFTGPLVIVLLLMYVLCIAGLIVYFKKTTPAKKEGAEPPAE